jgi:hypothetical protein
MKCSGLRAPTCERKLLKLDTRNFRTALRSRTVKKFAVLICVLAGLAGCARDDGEADLPEACTDSADAFVTALDAAPEPVLIDDIRISECLAKDSSTGDVQAVGVVVLEAAQRLSRERDAVALGYLVGALRRGAIESQGIHLELVRRVEQEAAPLEGSAAFERGLRAGRTSG